MTAELRPDGEPRLPLGTLLAFSLGSMPISAAGVAVSVYLPPYFAGHLGVSMAMVGAVWMLVRLADIPVDVGLALAMDRTTTPIGRYRPWLLAAAPIVAFAFWRLFMAPPHFSAGYLAVALLALYLGYSTHGLSTSAWGASLARTYHGRSRLFGIQTAVGILGAVGVLLVPILRHGPGATDASNVVIMGLGMVALTPICALIASVATPDRPLRLAAPLAVRPRPWRDVLDVLTKPDLLRLFLASLCLALGPGWMSALYIFYFTKNRGYSSQQASLLLAVYILAGVPGALGGSAVARRIGKHRTLMVSTSAYSLALFSVLIIPKGSMLVGLPFMAFNGAMAATFGMMIQAMLADVGDEVRLDQGRERMSLVYALNGLAAKLAAAFSIGFSLPLLQALGFDPRDGAVNTPAAMNHLAVAFLSGPIVFVMLGGACVIGWRMDAKRQASIRAELDAREEGLTT